jgi:DNA-binding protein WhiA
MDVITCRDRDRGQFIGSRLRVEAAVRQIQAIEKIESTIGIENLKSNLQEIARLRIQYPDMSLTDLGGLLDPPVGKSGINHRLRKICEIAEEL